MHFYITLKIHLFLFLSFVYHVFFRCTTQPVNHFYLSQLENTHSFQTFLRFLQSYLFVHNVMLLLCAMVFLMDMVVVYLLYSCYRVIQSHRVFLLPIFLKLHFQVLGPMLFLQFLVPCLKSCSLSINL